MAHHKSAKKRIRQNAKRRELNRYKLSSMRSAVKKLRKTTDKEAAEGMLPNVTSILDTNAKHNLIHKNKAANLKSKLTKYVNSL